MHCAHSPITILYEGAFRKTKDLKSNTRPAGIFN